MKPDMTFDAFMDRIPDIPELFAGYCELAGKEDRPEDVWQEDFLTFIEEIRDDMWE